MTEIQIANNIFVSPQLCISKFPKEITYDILRQVDLNFSFALDIQPFSSRHTLIYPADTPIPKCCPLGNFHKILLSAKDSFPQLVFQFSHEYCHHLIDGTMSGEIYGLMWLEETICELSSMYHLQVFYNIWSNTSEDCFKYHLAYLFQDYLQILLETGSEQLYHTLHQKGLEEWIPEYLLMYMRKSRKMRNDVAVLMYPLFLENPHLWKIILHFGDMRRWHSLEELFLHLRRNATPDYSDSLEKLHLLLLS